MNDIPKMTDEMGIYWDQPRDIRDCLMDETHVILDRVQFKMLCEYSASYPSGVYPGKCWKRQEQECWYLVWYGEVDENNNCSINYRKILPL